MSEPRTLPVLDENQIEQAAKFIRAGTTPEAAASMLGLEPDDFIAMLAAGEEGDPDHSPLFEAVAQASNEARVSAEVNLRTAAPMSWLAYQQRRQKEREKERRKRGIPEHHNGQSAVAKQRLGLNAKQERFAREFAEVLNATRAAIRAGYSEKTAHVQGPLLLEDPRIASLIERIMAARSVRTDVVKDKWVARTAELAFSDIGDILDFSGDVPRLRDAKDIPIHARRAISSVKVRRFVDKASDREVEILEFKLADKSKPLELLARALGFIKSGAFDPAAAGMFPFGAAAPLVGAVGEVVESMDFDDLAAEYAERLQLRAMTDQLRAKVKVKMLEQRTAIDVTQDGGGS